MKRLRTLETHSYLVREAALARDENREKGLRDDGDKYDMEDGEVESDLSCYRVLYSKTLADVVEALIGVYYVEGEESAHHLMNWIGIQWSLILKR
ncbi:hypothetical protein IFM89_018145 [Coptis chinensis]|uniref:RNase III domain-containing protein n=1 Tax=Coptis chinensis TaxID=261450 RepID=A0A835HVY8_9MAGN|nr:hypothetical protein IFM89_018145 [Coptis chinensis]